MIIISIDTSNAAFDGGGGHEVARILRVLADHYEVFSDSYRNEPSLALRDVNGNRVGYATYKSSEED